MARSEQSRAKRTERYNYLRSLGFSPSQARQLRDRSGGNIETTIDRTLRTLTATPARERSEPQTQQLRILRERHRTEAPEDRRFILESDRERRTNWSRWSSRDGKFPEEITRNAYAINRRAGRQPFDSYGFRVEFFRYVEGINPENISELIHDIYSGRPEADERLMNARKDRAISRMRRRQRAGRRTNARRRGRR